MRDIKLKRYRLAQLITGTDMVQDACKIISEGFHLADEIQFDFWHAEKIILQMPVSIKAMVGGRGSKLHKLCKRQ